MFVVQVALISDVGSPLDPSGWRVMEVAMIRSTDLIGVAGFVLVITASVLFFPQAPPSNEWTYWLGVFSVWLLGFVTIIGWVLTRWSVRRSKDNQAPHLIWKRRQR
jgi:hypothetical protein